MVMQIGEVLCKFQNDFDGFKNPDAYSNRLIINHKKHYINRIGDTEVNTYYHIHCKGVSMKAILTDAKGEALIDLCKSIYGRKEHTYNLVKGGSAFALNEDMTINSKSTFVRCLRGLISQGDLEWYMDKSGENKHKYFCN